MKRIITLCTDFGAGDAEIGSLYGAIWRIAPATRITDLTHGIERHNILQAALNLTSYTPYFPQGTIHVIVVDPGVGTQRRPLAARLGNQFYVAPDNGIITLVLQQAKRKEQAVEIVHLDQPHFWADQVNPIFHGRDLFAPVAAHLANGVHLQEMGAPLADPVLLQLSQPRPYGPGWRGEVIHIDHFGNLGTNIESSCLKGMGRVQVSLGGAPIGEMVRTFGERQPGELAAFLSGSGRVAIAVVNGSAERHLQAHTGDIVDVMPVQGQEGETRP
jgi:S-adenosyl-L-methionine hydrolase (adenosine-forming)